MNTRNFPEVADNEGDKPAAVNDAVRAIAADLDRSTDAETGALLVVELADADAPNGALYYSTTQSKVCYKRAGTATAI